MLLAVAAIPILVLAVYAVSTGKIFGSSAAREQQTADTLTREMIALTAQTNQKIHSINLSDLHGDSAKARALIDEARQTNDQAHEKAVRLASELESWTKSLSGISSPAGQKQAYEMVALESALISQFIDYTKELNNFFDVLGAAVTTNNQASRARVEQSLTEVNKKIAAVNNTSDEFLKKAAAF